MSSDFIYEHHGLQTDMAVTSHHVCVTMIDLLQAAKSIQPAAKREGFAVVPDVSWYITL